MELYIVTINNYLSGDSCILGVYSQLAKAQEAMSEKMAICYGQESFFDWDNDFNKWWYFYDHHTVEIQYTILDKNMDC